jgi:hypothetical protein
MLSLSCADMKLSTQKNPNPALALNAEKPRQRKVRSAVCIQSPQARIHNIWTFERLGEREKERERGRNKRERLAHPSTNGDHHGRCLEQAMKDSLDSEGSRPFFLFFSFFCLRCCCCKRMICCRCLIFFLLLPTELLVIWQRFSLPCLLLL